MILLKLVSLVLMAVTTFISHTPPNTTNTTRIVLSATLTERFIKDGFAAGLFKTFTIAFVVGECLVVLARSSPNNEHSAILLSSLCPSGDPWQIRLTASFVLGCALVVSGSLLRIQCYRTLGKLFTWAVTIEKDHQLVTTGPYRFVRHPSYTGCLMIYTGMVCWLVMGGSWVRECGVLGTFAGSMILGLYAADTIITVIAVLLRAPREDGVLKDIFGQEWDDWARQVPYRMIPGLY